MEGHRVAFNRAFQDLGYECVQFTPPIYNDLLSSGDGSAHGLVTAYFNCMGWPTMLATSEQSLFTRKVCETKTKMLSRMLKKDEVPLRPHVDEVIRDALNDSMRVGLIAGTQSDSADEVAQSVLRQLGPLVAAQVHVFSCQAASGEDASTSGSNAFSSSSSSSAPSTMGQALQDAAAREKQRTAASFVEALKREDAAIGSSSAPILLDSNLVASNRRKVSVDFLAALAAALGVRLATCLLLASSASVAEAGASAGITTVAIPRKMAAQGSFPGAVAKMDGYGSGAATWSRLKALLQSNTRN